MNLRANAFAQLHPARRLAGDKTSVSYGKIDSNTSGPLFMAILANGHLRVQQKPYPSVHFHLALVPELPASQSQVQGLGLAFSRQPLVLY